MTRRMRRPHQKRTQSHDYHRPVLWRHGMPKRVWIMMAVLLTLVLVAGAWGFFR
jgi:hypothetical protein